MISNVNYLDMKRILVIIGCLLVIGCANEAQPIDDKGNTMEKGSFIGYTIEVIDGCEYIGYDRSLTHKGDCKNKLHFYNYLAGKK